MAILVDRFGLSDVKEIKAAQVETTPLTSLSITRHKSYALYNLL